MTEQLQGVEAAAADAVAGKGAAEGGAGSCEGERVWGRVRTRGGRGGGGEGTGFTIFPRAVAARPSNLRVWQDPGVDSVARCAAAAFAAQFARRSMQKAAGRWARDHSAIHVKRKGSSADGTRSTGR